MPRDISAFEAGKGTHPDVVKLGQQECVDKVAPLDREFRIIDGFLRDLEPRRPRTQETTTPPPIQFRLRLARPCDKKRQVKLEEVVTFDHVRVALLDQM